MALLTADIKAMTERKVNNLISKLNTAKAKYEQLKSNEPNNSFYYEFEVAQINLKLDLIAEVRAEK